MKRIKDLFIISNGNGLALSDMQEDDKGYNFISRGEKNNGIVATIKKVKSIEPFGANKITVSLGGSVLESFYQDKPFYTAYHIKVLTPRFDLTANQMFYYCNAIKHNKYRYSYGRQANRTLDDLLIPDINEIPEWVNEIKLPKKPNEKPFHNKNVELKDRNWDWVNLIDYFKMYAGKYYSNDSFSTGKTPLVTSSDNNNGIMIYTDIKPKYKNCITIGKVGCSAFYQKDYFVASPDVTVLEPNFIMNQFHALFIVTLLNKEKFKWSYGRQIRLNDSKKLRLKMPITNEGIPDWDFIEYFMKSLPYSSNLKEQKKSSNDGLSDEELIEKYESGAIDLGEKIKKSIGKLK